MYLHGGRVAKEIPRFQRDGVMTRRKGNLFGSFDATMTEEGRADDWNWMGSGWIAKRFL